MTLRLTVNGESIAADVQSIAELLEARGIDQDARGLAVAVNGAVFSRKEWEAASLKDGDAVEIVKPFSGG
jgi:sulfur carrier protein